jgi:hypothetical protein
MFSGMSKYLSFFLCKQVGATLLGKPAELYQITLERNPKCSNSKKFGVNLAPPSPNSLKPQLKKQDSFESDEQDEKARQRQRSISFFSKRSFKRSMTGAAPRNNSGEEHEKDHISHQHSVPCTKDELTKEEMRILRERAVSMPRR